MFRFTVRDAVVEARNSYTLGRDTFAMPPPVPTSPTHPRYPGSVPQPPLFPEPRPTPVPLPLPTVPPPRPRG